MTMSRCYFCVLYFLLIPYLNLKAKELVIEKNSNKKLYTSDFLHSYVEKHIDVAFDSIPSINEEWKPVDGPVLSGGFGQVYWYKIKIKNHASNQVLVLRDGTIDFIDVFFVKDSNTIHQISSGDHRPFRTREIKVFDFVYKLPVDTFDCYIRIKNGTDFKSCLYISSFENSVERFQTSNLLWGGYIGILFVLIFYNFFIYLSTKEKAILWYVFYLIMLIISSTGVKGIAFQYLWPDNAFMNSFIPSFTSIYLIFMILFVNALLQIKKYDYKAFSLLKGFVCIYLVSILLNVIEFTHVWLIIQLSSTLLSVYLFLLGFKFHFKGQAVAKYFLFTWSLHLLLIILFVFQVKGYMPYNSFLINGLFFGSALEATLLSIVIGYKIKVLRLQKEAAENREILKQQEQHIFLREQAHEIQNPICYVSNYVGVLNRNFLFINKLLFLYKDLMQSSNDMDLKKQEIIKFESKINLNKVRKELFDGLNSFQVAIKRVENISKNFLTYDSKKEALDVNKILKDTLTIISLDLKDSVSIYLDLKQLSLLHGFSVQLEQVFINLLKNSAEAIKQKETLKDEHIIVRTSQDLDKICVEITDTGVGMSLDTQKKMFRNNFTTKSTGKGLGMGLCKRFIEDHSGTINITSKLGEGTTISIYFQTI